MTSRFLAAFFVSFVVSMAVGFVLVPMFRKLKAGQSIREDGPVWHKKKEGTPTMGGLIFITGITVACLTIGLPEIKNGEYGHIFVLVFALIFAAIGFLDDFEKLKNKRNLGLTALQKFFLQLAVAIAYLMLMRLTGHLTPSLYVPFFNVTLILNEVVYFIFASFVIVGCVNAVNITDGVDGLVTGVSLPIAACYTAIAAIWGYSYFGIFSAALAGGLAAFLIFNFHPAKIFMGDTGSLFLGGAICGMAFALDIPLILVPLGIIFIIETLSDVIQVSYFKLTHGKRVFKMAPLHHHFEMCGWSEYKLFTVYSVISAAFAVISYFSVCFRYPS